ncbi:MAG: Holliday junction resolvase RuvX [Acholeplasma sp.]|nr:Holliday junction resolvase RuvX [Acholeplasma sp.]
MVYIGLDLGEKTLGIARSDSGIIAQALMTHRFYENHYEDASKFINQYINKEKVDVVVLGYPKHMNNDVGIRAKISEDFKALIEKNTKAEVILWDERLSTFHAQNQMIEVGIKKDKRKKKKDEMAAQVILQSYLEYKGDI